MSFIQEFLPFTQLRGICSYISYTFGSPIVFFKGKHIGFVRTKTQVMNKCIAFFIVLVLVLVVAVLTDNERATSHENNLVEHKVDTNKNRSLVDNKAVTDRRY
tara:strand:- start:2903 stop:3211 length:309 start_codon:yes stop_codon:yes gene_type:complete